MHDFESEPPYDVSNAEAARNLMLKLQVIRTAGELSRDEKLLAKELIEYGFVRQIRHRDVDEADIMTELGYTSEGLQPPGVFMEPARGVDSQRDRAWDTFHQARERDGRVAFAKNFTVYGLTQEGVELVGSGLEGIFVTVESSGIDPEPEKQEGSSVPCGPVC